MKTMVSEYEKLEEALKFFPYFETWSSKTISECSRLSKIKVFPPHNVIIGPDEIETCKTHFILDGTCKLIQQLLLEPIKTRGARMRYRISCTSGFSNQRDENDLPKFSSMLFNLGDSDQENSVADEIKIPEITVEETDVTSGNGSSLYNKREEIEDSGREKAQENRENEKASTASAMGNATDVTVETNESVVSEEKATEEENGGDAKPCHKNGRFSHFYRRRFPYLCDKRKHNKMRLEQVECHFFQIGLVSRGCCLGLGENLQNRFLVSTTEVTCLVIPLQFLLQHNPSNVWNRIKQFLIMYLPTEERILNEFMIYRGWYQDKLMLVSGKHNKKTAKVRDVPISIRLHDSAFRFQ